MYFDIQSSEQTVKTLFNNFNIKTGNNPNVEDYKKLDAKLRDMIDIYYNEKIYDSNYKKNLSKSSIGIHNLCIGDLIEIEYIPPSMKYLNDYPKLYGIVIYIDIDNNDGLIYSNNGVYEKIYSITRNYCGYGYDASHILIYHITRFEKNNLII